MPEGSIFKVVLSSAVAAVGAAVLAVTIGMANSAAAVLPGAMPVYDTDEDARLDGGEFKVYMPFVLDNPSTVVLYDSFSGSGTLPNHLPEIRPIGSAWTIVSGIFSNLDGSGILSYSGGAIGGENGAAIIDTRINDFDLSARIRTGSNGEEIGVIVRGDAALANFIRPSLNSQSDEAKLSVSGSGGGSCSGTIALEDDTFYTIRVVGWGGTIRFYVDGIFACGSDANASYGTLAGVSTLQGSAGAFWDWIQVSTINKHDWKIIAFFGDSITQANPGWVSPVVQSYHQGMTKPFNHAVSGARAGDGGLGDQIDQAQIDNMALSIILMGTNDWTDFTQIYKEELIHLWSVQPGKPIYALGILNRSPDNNRGTVNGYISEAVAQAQAAGVEVTYWNTDGWIDPITDTSDGLHPNGEGNAKVAAEVLARLP